MHWSLESYMLVLHLEKKNSMDIKDIKIPEVTYLYIIYLCPICIDINILNVVWEWIITFWSLCGSWGLVASSFLCTCTYIDAVFFTFTGRDCYQWPVFCYNCEYNMYISSQNFNESKLFCIAKFKTLTIILKGRTWKRGSTIIILNEFIFS